MKSFAMELTKTKKAKKKAILPIPKGFANRRPVLKDFLLFIPSYYDKHQEFEMPALGNVFQNDNPINIEYCSGNGQWIIDKAKNNPNINWIAVEKRFDRVLKIFKKLHDNNIKNLLVVFGEALTFSNYYLTNNSIDNIYINFPDPWPKDRHAKHRLITNEFIDRLKEITIKKGCLFFATDDRDTSSLIINTCFSNKSLKSQIENPYFKTKFEGYGNSYFEKLWLDKGRTIHYMQFINEKL
jgi:tRNA (guanine-N7-)-methyltransferase